MDQKLSVGQIAERRNLAETTVLGHIERMSYGGESLDLEHLAPAPDVLRKIRDAFHASGNTLLRPVRESLEEEFTYDELRLARMYCSRPGSCRPARPASDDGAEAATWGTDSRARARE